jgi:cell division protein FtsB
VNTFVRFLYEFLSQFFSGLIGIFKGLFDGIVKMFDIPAYIKIIQYYKSDFKVSEWIMVFIAVLVMILVLGLIIALIIYLIRKYIRIRKSLVDQESLLQEIADLNNQVAKLVQEKEDILAMKVSQLGLKPGEENTVEAD